MFSNQILSVTNPSTNRLNGTILHVADTELAAFLLRRAIFSEDPGIALDAYSKNLVKSKNT